MASSPALRRRTHLSNAVIVALIGAVATVGGIIVTGWNGAISNHQKELDFKGQISEQLIRVSSAAIGGARLGAFSRLTKTGSVSGLQIDQQLLSTRDQWDKDSLDLSAKLDEYFAGTASARDWSIFRDAVDDYLYLASHAPDVSFATQRLDGYFAAHRDEQSRKLVASLASPVDHDLHFLSVGDGLLQVMKAHATELIGTTPRGYGFLPWS